MRVLLKSGGIVLLLCATAQAHIAVTSHETRHGKFELKSAPCGAETTERGTAIYTYLPGETIQIDFDEYIDHPGHYRVAFDADGTDDFVDPAGFDDLYTNDAVLLDGIEDREDGGDYTIDVTLPDVECTNCTLQIMQVMTDKPPYGDGNDLYYECIDLVLSLDAEAVDNPGDEGSGCSHTPPAAWWLLPLPFLLLRRRR